MEKAREKLSEEVIAIAFEYSSDAKKMLASLYQALSFEGKESEERKFLLYPYSGSVYTNSSLIKPNDIELGSYFDNNIGEPQRQTDRDNLHNQFKDVYEKVKAIKAKKKKIYFIVSSKYDSFQYSPFEYMASHITGISTTFLCIESMKELIEPFVRSNLLNSKLTTIRSRSLLDSTYSPEKITEVICEMLSNIPEITVSEKAKAVAHEKLDPDDLFTFFDDDKDLDDELPFWGKTREKSLEISEAIAKKLSKKFPHHLGVIEQLKSSLYKALCNDSQTGLRGCLSIVEDKNNIYDLISEFLNIVKQELNLPGFEMDCSLAGNDETAFRTYALGVSRGYSQAGEWNGKIPWIIHESHGKGIIFIKQLNRAPIGGQAIFARMIEECYCENSYNGDRYRMDNYFVITSVSCEDFPKDTTIEAIADKEKYNLSKAVAAKLSSGDIVFSKPISPILSFFFIKNTLRKAISNFEIQEKLKVNCEIDQLANLIFLSSMNHETAIRQADGIMDDIISSHVAHILQENNQSLGNVDFHFEIEDIDETINYRGFIYPKNVSNLDTGKLRNFDHVPSRSELLEGDFDYCVLLPSKNNRDCHILLETIKSLPKPFPIFVVANDAIERESYILSGATSVIIFDDTPNIENWINEQIAGAMVQKRYMKLKNSAQYLTYQTEVSLVDNVVHISFYNLELHERFDKEDEDFINRHRAIANTNFDDIIGLEEAKCILDATNGGDKILLYGPAGTGKTLLANAVATKLSKDKRTIFLVFSANEFLQSLVGKGEAELNFAFDLAEKYSEIDFFYFIDEIDLLCMSRQSTSYSIHTSGLLNVFLNRLDGFTRFPETLTLVVATNLRNALDDAILRRFPRQISIDPPRDLNTRIQIIEHYLKKHTLSCNREIIGHFATRTQNLSPSIINNTMDNARENAKIKHTSFEDELLPTLEENLYGKMNEGISQTARLSTAIHEAAHSIVAKKFNRNVSYISIVPRGNFAGYTYIESDTTKLDQSKDELIQQITILLAGRAAEMIFMGHDEGCTTGAKSDLERASQLARAMIAEFGFGKSLLTLPDEILPDAVKISQIEEAEAILQECFKTATKMVKEYEYEIRKLSKKLLEDYTIMGNEIDQIISPHSIKTAI